MQSTTSVGADGSPDDEMLGGATIIQALIKAAEIDKDNEHVVYLKAHGISAKDTCEFVPDTPPDVIKWAVSESNNWHIGSSATVIEILGAAKEAEYSWTAHARENAITTRGCPSKGEFAYEKQYEAFVTQNCGQHFQHKWQRFMDAKVFVNVMSDERPICDVYTSTAEQRCNFLSSELQVWAHQGEPDCNSRSQRLPTVRLPPPSSPSLGLGGRGGCDRMKLCGLHTARRLRRSGAGVGEAWRDPGFWR